jgi:hypothetical protein
MQTKTNTRKTRIVTAAEADLSATVIIAAVEEKDIPKPSVKSDDIIGADWGHSVRFARYHSAYTPH